MTNGKVVSITSIVALAILVGAILTFSACNPYESLLQKQGYTPMKTPRTALGAGTIFALDNGVENFKTAPSECFPNIEQSMIPNKIQLMDSKQESGLEASAGAKYLPVSLPSLSAAFSFNSIKKLDVKFGPTRADVLTVEGFARYLEGRSVSKRCFAYLREPKNLVILSAAMVERMDYQFHGEKKVGGTFNADVTKAALNGEAKLEYSNITTDGMTVAQPMYIAYQAFHFKNLGIDEPEGTEAPVKLTAGKFTLEQVK
jgi:hypothetical protein